MPTKSAGTPTLLSGKYSPAKYALSFFSHVIWKSSIEENVSDDICLEMIIVKKDVETQYRRTIRNKCDLLRDKYDKEIKTKRETDLKMKEIALKPIHTHHYHQNERPRRPETSRSRPRTPENEKVYLPKPPTFINDDNQINVPYPTHIIQSSGEKIKKGSKDGLTNSYAVEMLTKPSQNLTTNAVAPLDKVMTVAPSGIEAPELSDVAKPTMQLLHSTSSSAPVACSTTPTTITTKSQDKIKVEPHVIAATSHAILTGGWKGVEKRPIYEGLILLNKDNSKHGKCPTDRELMISSSDPSYSDGSSPHDLRKIEIQSPIIDTGKAFESLVKQISSSDSPLQTERGTLMRRKKPSRFDSWGEKNLIGAATQASKYKRRRTQQQQQQQKQPQRQQQQQQHWQEQRENDALSSTVISSSKSFFPFWSCTTKRSTTVESSRSPTSGTSRGDKILSTEKSIWSQSTFPPTDSTPTSKAVIEMASSLPLPVTGLDVYALRRQKERMTLVRPPVMDLPDDPQVNQTQQSRSPVNRYSNGELVTNGKSLLSRNTIVL